MGKNKEEKKRKRGVFLETAPVCVPTYENFQKDQLQTKKVKESPISDFSGGMRNCSEKPQKRQKRKHFLEQQTENDCSTEQQTENDCFTEHTEGHHERRKKKKKKIKHKEVCHVEDTYTEDVDLLTCTVEAPKKKKKKTRDVNEVEELKIETVSEMSIETPTVEKKKKSKKKKIVSENRTETGEVSLTVNSEIQCSEDLKKKKKNKKSNTKGHDSLLATEETCPVEEADTETKTNAFTDVYLKHLNELKEFIPDIESKEPVLINKMIRYDLQRFKELKKHGKWNSSVG